MKNFVLGLGVAGAVTAATLTGAWAGWGCGVKGTVGNTNRGYNDFAESTQAQAQADLIQYCKQNGITNCKIIGCNANVDTAPQAQALWPKCGAANQPKC